MPPLFTCDRDEHGAPVCDLCGEADRPCTIVTIDGYEHAICLRHPGDVLALAREQHALYLEDQAHDDAMAGQDEADAYLLAQLEAWDQAEADP